MTVAIMALVGPMLNSSTTMTRYENAGTVCMASSTGRKTASNAGCRAQRMPTGIPIASATATESRMSAKVSRLGAHMPNRPIARNPSPARMALRQPAR